MRTVTLAIMTVMVAACSRATVVEGSTVEGVKLERGESFGHLATDRGRLLVEVGYRTPHQDVPAGGDEKEYSSVRIVAADRVTATTRRRGVLRRIVPVNDGFAILRVIAEGDARNTVTELSFVDRHGAERVVFSGKQDLTGMFEGAHGEWVLFGRTKVLVASSATRDKWVSLPIGGLEPGESISGMASLNADEYLAVTSPGRAGGASGERPGDSRLLRHARSSGALLSAEVVARYPYSLQLISERRLWVVRAEQGSQELLLVESNGRLRHVKGFDASRVRSVSSTAGAALIIEARGDHHSRSRRLLKVSLAGDARSEELARLPEDAMDSIPWKGGLVVATPLQLFFLNGVQRE